MSILSRIFGGQTKPRKTGRRDQFFAIDGRRGGYDGARFDRLTEDWNPGSLPPNLLHQMDGKLLRERASDLVRNNPLAASAVNSYAANVIERGICPQQTFADQETRAIWAKAWEHWQSREADVTRVQDFYGLQELVIREVIIGGGCLLHFVEVDRRRNRRRRLPLCIELISEDRFVEDRDAFTVAARPGKNPIIRGVEVDRHTGEPVAYWIKSYTENEVGSSYGDPIRLPAEDCSYAFLRQRIGQQRGVTLLGPCIMWLWKLGYYTDNELMASAIASCFVMAVETSDTDPQSLLGESGEDDVDARGNKINRVEPGLIFYGNPGQKCKGITPGRPNGDATPWISMIARSIGVGIDLSYEELMRDSSQANFSASRMSTNADRRRFRKWQKFIKDYVCWPTYERWVESAVRIGLQGFPGPVEFGSDPDSYLQVEWREPGWPSIDPLKDAQAAEVELANGLNDRASIISARGGDWEATFAQLAKEREAAESSGIEVSPNDRPAAQQNDTLPAGEGQ